MPLKERLRAKKRRQQATEQAELESAERKKRVHKSDVLIAKIDFSELIYFSFWSQTAFRGLETASVALDFDEFDKNATAGNPEEEARQHTTTNL